MVFATHLHKIHHTCKLLTCCYGGSHFARSSTEQAICDIADNDAKKQLLHHVLIHEKKKFLASQGAQHQAMQFLRPENFSSTSTGTYLTATQIFHATFFAPMKPFIPGNSIICRDRPIQLGLKSGPTVPSSDGNNLVAHNTNSSILPLHHSPFRTFTKAIHHEKTDVTLQATWKQQCLTRHLTRLASRTSEKTSIPHMSWTGSESDHSKQFIEAFNHERDVITSFAVPEPNPMHDSEGATPTNSGIKFLHSLLRWHHHHKSSSHRAQLFWHLLTLEAPFTKVIVREC
jgi:hypothetical protein